MRLFVSFLGFILRYEQLTKDLGTWKESLQCASHPTNEEGRNSRHGKGGARGHTDPANPQEGRKQGQLLLGKRTRRNEECVEMRNHDRSRTIHIRGKQTVEKISQKENQQQQPPSPMPGGQK